LQKSLKSSKLKIQTSL